MSNLTYNSHEAIPWWAGVEVTEWQALHQRLDQIKQLAAIHKQAHLWQCLTSRVGQIFPVYLNSHLKRDARLVDVSRDQGTIKIRTPLNTHETLKHNPSRTRFEYIESNSTGDSLYSVVWYYDHWQKDCISEDYERYMNHQVWCFQVMPLLETRLPSDLVQLVTCWL